MQKINFKFADGEIVAVKFNYSPDETQEIITSISQTFARRYKLRESAFVKYLVRGKKSVLSHRRLTIEFIDGGKVVETMFSAEEVSNKLLGDAEALAEMLHVCFSDFHLAISGAPQLVEHITAQWLPDYTAVDTTDAPEKVQEAAKKPPTEQAEQAATAPKRRGRPKGSKNKK